MVVLKAGFPKTCAREEVLSIIMQHLGFQDMFLLVPLFERDKQKLFSVHSVPGGEKHMSESQVGFLDEVFVKKVLALSLQDDTPIFYHIGPIGYLQSPLDILLNQEDSNTLVA